MSMHKIYVVASTENVKDVEIENVYDGDWFNLDTIVAGLNDKLRGHNYQVTYLDDNAYIDLIDDNDELVRTYTIVSKHVGFHD